MPMIPSRDAYQLIKAYEGLRLAAYQDSGGKWTIGWGHTGDVSPGMTITQHQAEALLALDISTAAQAVSRSVRVALTQAMFDALVSFTFNLGPGRLWDSTLLARINVRDYAGAAKEFARWTKGRHKGKKVVLSGLVKRREAERELFLRDGLL